MKRIGLFIAVLFLTISSCKEKKEVDYKPASIGAINSLTLVIDNDLWKGKVGDKIRAHFAAPTLGLSWEEPLFTINQLPAKVFTGTIRQTRSLLYVQKDTLNIGHVKTDLYAKPQKVGVIKGRTDEEIIANIDAKADEIIKAFKSLEIAEAQKRFLRSLNKEKALENNLGITLNLPSVYKVGREEDNFVWIDRQIPKGNMNVIAYSMPADNFKNDATFVKDIIRMRDSIGQAFIPGSDEGSYMITEKAFAPYVFPAEIGGKKAVEVRGIWEMHGYPMAGPFLTYIINDKEKNRKIVIEGFVFAPSTAKRDYMFELEAILKTIKFLD